MTFLVEADMVSSVRISQVAALAILLVGFTTQMTSASAAALPRASEHASHGVVTASHARAAAGSAAARTASDRSHPSAVIRPRIRPAPGFGPASRPPLRDTRRGPAVGSAAASRASRASRAKRAAAVRTALGGTQVPDTCSGLIEPDIVYPCTTPSSSGTDTFTLSLTSTTDLLLFQIFGASGSTLSFTLTAPGGATVSCQQPSYNQMPQCPTSQAGTYTLQVQNEGSSYTLAYRPLLSDPSCTVANPSFASPALTASLAAGSVGACYTLAMAAGQVLHVNSTAATQDLLVTVYDSTGTQICADDQGDCPLSGVAPYFVEADAISGDAITYDLELNNITDPQGCLKGPQLIYGAAPDTSSADRCRTLTVSTAGQYQVYAVSPQDGLVTSTLYLPDGTSECTNTYSTTGPTCQLAAGRYNLVADPYPGFPATVGAVFIAADESRGCKATGDSDFGPGPATGTFKGTGEEICLTLPAAAGPAVYLLDQPAKGGTSPQLEVVDATGAQVCQNNYYLFTNCTLAGTKPFRIILSGQSAGGGYRILAQSSRSTGGCEVWPQSGFGGSWGATVKLTPAADAACLVIPARQHSAGEMIDYSNLANTVDAGLYVYDPDGTNICLGTSVAVCPMSTGVTYTALLISSTGKADTYHLVRRDVSSTAHCSAPSSTVAGGPSTTLELTSDLDTQCLRVTAPATDDFSFDVRAEAPNSAGAVLLVTDASGGIVCNSLVTIFCNATGSTSYQLVVDALNYQGIAITAHVDAWLVATASGFAPQCAANQLSGATGWAPIQVNMSEAAVGYCAVVTVQANEYTTIYSPSSTNTGVDQPFFMLESATNWSSGQDLCGVGQPYGACDLLDTAPGQYVLLIYPYQMPLPTTISFQGACSLECSAYPVITSVTPATGPAGSVNQLVVGGTDLNLGVQVELASDANVVAEATPVSVSASGTALTVSLNTQGVAPGTYDVVQFGVGYTVGVPSPGYLPGAYQVTAAPPVPPVGSFVPRRPARILDTQTGLGGQKGPVPPGGVVALQVAGVAGVPATGVSAVVLSVTAQQPARSGTVIVYPDGAAQPQVTDLSFSRGEASSDQVVVPVLDGKIDLYNDSPGRTDLLAVLSGYFTTRGTHGLLTAVNATRILDTRTGLGAPQAPVGAGQTVPLTVDGAGGVPASGVSAVELSVTVVDPSDTGALTAFADGSTRPAASQLAFNAGQTTAGLITIPVVNGKVDLYNGSSGPVNLTADVTGYFSGQGTEFQTEGPVRALDTLTGLGGTGVNVLAHAAADFGVDDLPGWQGSEQDAVLSVTVFDTHRNGSLSVFPDGSALPADPNIVFRAGKPVTVQVIVPVTGPTIDFYNDSDGTIQITADVQGYGVAPA
jgi:hypothetical protein